jgi:hypothetical protein
MKTFPYVRYCTFSEVWDYWRNKIDGDLNVSENNCDARVALCASPTRTHIQEYKLFYIVFNHPFEVTVSDSQVRLVELHVLTKLVIIRFHLI